MEHDGMNRRSFLHGAGRGGAVAMTASYWSKVLGANDRIRVGAVGVGVRGRFDLECFAKQPNVEVRALCDVWGSAIEEARKLAPAAKTYRDYRKMLEDEKLDVLLVATPDHWHVPIAIDAMNAGLDVYVEKPVTLTLEEGPRIVKAARVNGRVCQVGLQSRSNPNFLQIKRDYFDNGRLGKVTLVRTSYNGNQYHLRTAPESLKNQPTDLDWANFLGRLNWRDWDPQQYWNWRAYLDFGGGQIGDLFVHMVDLIHLMLGQDNPVSAAATGGVLFYKDGRTAPDTIALALQYPGDLVVTFEASLVRGSRATRGLAFLGTDGALEIDWSNAGVLFYPPEVRSKPVPVVTAGTEGTLEHVANFLDCVRSRKLPNADIYIGHRSAQAAHLGKIAYLEQRRVHFDPVREAVLSAARERPGFDHRPAETA
jgi:predicted dehydrogenase